MASARVLPQSCLPAEALPPGALPGGTAELNLVDIGSPAISTAVIEGLSSGTWYFTVASYTNVGVESAQTQPVSRTVP